MKNRAYWAWTLVSLAALACAKAEGGADPNGTGDGDGDGDGNTLSGGSSGTGGANGSGGVLITPSGGMSNMGGATNSGGMTATGGTGGMAPACDMGPTADCSAVFPAYPVGTTTCVAGAYSISDCLLCEPDSTVACAVADPTRPEGTVTCNSSGLDYVEEPSSVCTQCEQGVDTIDCDDAANLTTNRGGEATCGPGGYDFTECTVCDDGMTAPTCAAFTSGVMQGGTVVCTDGDWDSSGCTPCVADTPVNCVDIVGGDEAYTGGTTACNASGTGFIEPGSCTWCGDDTVNDGEDCDGADVPATTCDDLGLPDGDSGGANLNCTASCEFDTTVCALCDNGFSSCLGDDAPANCSDSACNNAQCAAGADCNMTCAWQNSSCTSMSCNEGATCDVACGGGMASCEIECKRGSNCNLVGANPWQSQPQGTFNCADGGVCTYDVASGPTFPTTGVTFRCESGSDCTFDSIQYGQTINGIVCEAGATCTMVATQGNATFGYTCESGATCDCPSGSTCNCAGDGC